MYSNQSLSEIDARPEFQELQMFRFAAYKIATDQVSRFPPEFCNHKIWNSAILEFGNVGIVELRDSEILESWNSASLESIVTSSDAA